MILKGFSKSILLATYLFWAGFFFVGEAQTDGQYSMYMKNKVVVNPAYAGFSGGLRASGINKTYWSGVENAPGLTYFAIDLPLKMVRGGLGVKFTDDSYGLWSSQAIELMYSYHMPFKQGKLAMGLQVGARDHGFDGSAAITSPEGGSGYHQGSDPGVPVGKESEIVLDFGLGTYYEDERRYFSLSLLHLSNPKVSYEGAVSSYLARTLLLSGAYIIETGMRGVELQPSAMIRSDFSVLQIDLNLIGTFGDRFWGGLGYRMGESLSFMLGVNFDNGLEIGYAYDMGVNSLISPGEGSQEIYASYTLNLDFKRNKNKHRNIRVL